MKFEIEPVCWPDYPHLNDLGTLTGLDLDELIAASKDLGIRWNGQTYIKLLNNLGFNTGRGFVKFDANTQYPCLLRLSRSDDKYWYTYPYYDGFIYHGLDRFDLKSHSKLINGKYFLTLNNKPYKITSMLQVWI